MKHTLLIITALMLVVGCSKPIDVDKLVERGGLLYEVNSDKPYSGPVFSLYENGQMSEEGTLKNGKADGKATEWNKNGQKSLEATFKDGELDGRETHWYVNGQKSYEGTYKDGEKDGKTVYWDENGQKRIEETYKDGYRISEECWDEDGNEMDCPRW
jgi:antitoxin component YwqK of YwqJK toxin-antitoxin module